MAQLIAELEIVKSPAEMEATREIYKQQIQDEVAYLKTELKRYKHTMWSIDAEKRLHNLTATMEKVEDRTFEALEDETIISHINSIISMAQQCQSNKTLLLIHTPA